MTTKGNKNKRCVRDDVLIIAHADGDGYLAAEQSRRNVEKEGDHVGGVMIDPRTTANYRFWTKVWPYVEIEKWNKVIICDIMLGRSNASDTVASIEQKAAQNPQVKIIVVDHRMYDVQSSEGTRNVTYKFTETAHECCYGPPEELMLLASVCENEIGHLRDRITDWHVTVARGIVRAAADRAGVAGPPLFGLIRNERWDIFKRLGEESKELHRRVRGWRVKYSPVSEALEEARAAGRMYKE